MAEHRRRFPMAHLPLRLHILVLAATFLGWIATSVVVDRLRGKHIRIPELLIDAVMFTALMTFIDCLTLMTARRDRT